jgi:DNA-binding PadR family transcriptional regulator
MEHRGLIKSRWGESETGRKRKYYSLKKDGKAAMAKHHEQWSLVHSVLAGLHGLEKAASKQGQTVAS